MEKAELLRIVDHHINATPLRSYIKRTMDSKFKGHKDSMLTTLDDSCTASELQDLIFSFFGDFPRYIHVYQQSQGTFTPDNIADWLANYNLDENIGGNSFVANVAVNAEKQLVHFFCKAKYEYYEVSETGVATSEVRRSSFWVPTAIEFLPPRYAKVMFGKFRIERGIRNVDELGLIRITDLDFPVEQYAADFAGSEIAGFLNKDMIATNLSKGIKKFVEDKKISTTDVAWALPDNVNNKRHWRSDSKLYSYTYVHNRIKDALDVHPAKWYLTDSRRAAQNQEIRKLSSFKAHPALGVVRTNKFDQSATLEPFINELIDESN